MLYFTIGLPRSGKSTVCNQWVKHGFNIWDNQIQPKQHTICGHVHISSDMNPRVVICSDDIRIALHGCRWSSVAEEQVSAIQGTMIRAMLNKGYDVLVDGTHTTKQSIERMFKFNPDAQFVYFNTSSDLCKQRAMATQQDYLCQIIDRMKSNLSALVSVHCGYNSSFVDDPEFIDVLTRRIAQIKKDTVHYDNKTVL